MQIPVTLSPESRRSLQDQLFEEIRHQILSGALRPGMPMPATRALSEQLGVSRNTVVFAYERLIAEDYLYTRATVGTFVNPHLPEDSLRLAAGRVDPCAASPVDPDPRWRVAFRGRAQMVVNPARDRLLADFWVGRPDPDSFPVRPWRRLLLRNLARAGSNLAEYRDPMGIFGLRAAIAHHLRATRGVRADAEQVVVVNGSQQALNLVARLFLAPGARVVIECPCYQGAAYLFESYGAELVSVPVDHFGIDIERLPAGPADVAYVTPSHQYPTGVTLALDRRLRLIEWAARSGACIVEDDYDSDFRHHGSPLTALAGLDRYGHVVYMGTFSKSIGAGLRLGYLVVPAALVEAARTVKTLLDNGHAWLDQAVLADFIASGAFEQHLRRIRHLYLARRDCLIEALHHHFGEVELQGTGGGMHVAWRLPAGFPPASEIQCLAEQLGVGVYAMEGVAGHTCAEACNHKQMILFGYSSLSEPLIREGVARVARAVDEARSQDGLFTMVGPRTAACNRPPEPPRARP